MRTDNHRANTSILDVLLLIAAIFTGVHILGQLGDALLVTLSDIESRIEEWFPEPLPTVQLCDTRHPEDHDAFSRCVAAKCGEDFLPDYTLFTNCLTGSFSSGADKETLIRRYEAYARVRAAGQGG